MFTGIVEETGTVRAVRRGAHSAALSIGASVVLSGLKIGDSVAVDFDTGVITDETTGKTYQAQPYPEFLQNIIRSGGLMESIKG